MNGEVAVVVVLALAQAGAIRFSQYLLPEFYFGSGSVFTRRSEVKWKAVLFRLGIPFSAGLLVPFLVADHELRTAAATGFVAWFLALWPIFWAWNVMVPHIERLGLVVALWFVFWAAFPIMSASGAALTTWSEDVLEDSDSPWWQGQLASYAFLAVPAAFVTILASRFVNREVRYQGEMPKDWVPSEYDETDEWDEYEPQPPAPSRSWREPADWQFTAALLSVIALPLMLLALLVAVLRQGAKR